MQRGRLVGKALGGGGALWGLERPTNAHARRRQAMEPSRGSRTTMAATARSAAQARGHPTYPRWPRPSSAPGPLSTSMWAGRPVAKPLGHQSGRKACALRAETGEFPERRRADMSTRVSISFAPFGDALPNGLRACPMLGARGESGRRRAQTWAFEAQIGGGSDLAEIGSHRRGAPRTIQR